MVEMIIMMVMMIMIIFMKSMTKVTQIHTNVMTYSRAHYFVKEGPTNSGRGLPPPWFGQCLKVNILIMGYRPLDGCILSSSPASLSSLLYNMNKLTPDFQIISWEFLNVHLFFVEKNQVTGYLSGSAGREERSEINFHISVLCLPILTAPTYWPLPLAVTVGRTTHGQLPKTTRDHPW